MSLTVGTAPFGSDRTGRFDFDAPDSAVYVEPFARRVRAVREGRTVIDSDAVVMIHETGSLPRYAFPRADVEMDANDERHADDMTIEDIAWQYDDGVRREAERVSGLIAFYDEHVDIEVDGSKA